MKKIAIFAGLVLLAAPAAAQRDFSSVEIKATEVTEGIYMLEGAGGNMGLSVGDDGAFLIDDQFAPLSDKIRAAISGITDKPVEFVLNTHYHGDHTGGNEAFGASGSHIIAHDNVRVRLAGNDKIAEDALPVITFSDTATFYRNGEEIFVFHPGHAHTDGDAIVYFKTSNTVHMGDTFFAGRYPYIDLDGGGSFPDLISSLEKVAEVINDETNIIPGHGALSKKADLLETITMLKSIKSLIAPLVASGKTEEEVIAADPLAGLNEDWAWQFIDGERMTQIAYRSLQAKTE